MTNAPPPIAYASPVVPSADSEHLRLLAMFHWIVGGIQVLFGFFPILHLVFGILAVSGKFLPSTSPSDQADVAVFG